MEGIPEEVAQAHNQRIIQQFYQAEAERRAATGNPGPGGNAGGQPKKPKFESPSDLKKRLAEHKARKEAEKAAGTSSGGNTPLPLTEGGAQNSPLGQSPASFVSFAVLPIIACTNSCRRTRHLMLPLQPPIMALHKVRVMDRFHKSPIRSLR